MIDGSTNSRRELWNDSAARRHGPVAVVIVRQDMIRTKGRSDSWQVVEEAVDGFHAAALRNGGTDNGPSGLRLRYGQTYYAASVIDPDGYRLEAVCQTI